MIQLNLSRSCQIDMNRFASRRCNWPSFNQLLLYCLACFASLHILCNDEVNEREESEIEEIVVVSRSSVASDHLSNPSTSRLGQDEIALTGASHPNEVMNLVPGVWISRGSGQEHLTAIRSGVLTGAGACGAYLIMENGIPIRPPSFCNVNGLMEVNTEQSSTIEVIKGPASSRYGGNALHGAINVVTVLGEDDHELSAELGGHDWHRVQVKKHHKRFGISGIQTHSNGWRDETGYTHHKVNLQYLELLGEWSAFHTIAYSALRQETGGYVIGKDAYKDATLRLSNPNPEAYRDAEALRLNSHFTWKDLIWSLYFRHNHMKFLMHFLPGQPVEENSHQSIGSLARWRHESDSKLLELGVQIEFFTVDLLQSQEGPTVGSAFLVATRPSGTHYDFNVVGSHKAIYHDGRFDLSETLSWSYRIRSELAKYDYGNLGWDGNTRDDGSACGFGGCLYTRPADRRDSFSDLSLKTSLEKYMNESLKFHFTVGTGFRPPQVTELYRLQSGQEFADIDSEGLSSIELGLQHVLGQNEIEVSVYSSRNKNLIIRDSEGFNQNGGRVQSLGLEWLVRRQITPKHSIRLNGTLARHQYDIDLTLSRGARIEKGNDVDTAPRHLVSARWKFQPNSTTLMFVDLVRVGEYFVDIENSATYPGHTVANMGMHWNATEKMSLYGRILNLTDTLYADRADLAFGNHRYFPAAGRDFRFGLSVDL